KVSQHPYKVDGDITPMLEDNNKQFNSKFDMATAVKTVTSFGGEEEEDVGTWIRDILLVAEVLGWQEEEMVRVVVVSLKGKARSWASQILGGKISSLDWKSLNDLLRRRFCASRIGQVTLTKFCALGIVQSREEYSEMLRQATAIYEKEVVTLRALAEMVVQKTPSEIKTYLWQTARNTLSWEDFIQMAEEVAGIAFPDKMLSRVEHGRYTETIRPQYVKKGFSKHKNNLTNYKGEAKGSFRGYTSKWKGHAGKPYCVIHGEGNHTTSQCMEFTVVLNRERTRVGRKVESIAEDEVEDKTSGDNKQFLFYLNKIGETRFLLKE
ncbi:MAG: hypothetical protein ACRC28_08430, partial [Clostridium sp.]|uniref:hypothetical protein n=1 Tax=Clostridium sp. TaxID=1506 RepID=UPI003F2F11B0